MRPDEEAGRVEGDRRTLAHLLRALEKPFRDLGEGRRTLSDVAGEVLATLESGAKLRWCDIRLAELELERIAAEFGKEDAMKPQTREALNDCKQHVTEIATYLTA